MKRFRATGWNKDVQCVFDMSFPAEDMRAAMLLIAGIEKHSVQPDADDKGAVVSLEIREELSCVNHC